MSDGGRSTAEGPIGQMTERLMDACVEIGMSWSGSCIGYHATVYLDAFRQPQGGEIFDREWGLGERYSRSIGRWVPSEYDIVNNAIFRRSGVSDHMPLVEAAHKALGEARTCTAIPNARPSSGITNHDPDTATNDRPIPAAARWRIAVRVLSAPTLGRHVSADPRVGRRTRVMPSRDRR
jgi:hypothetical protein